MLGAVERRFGSSLPTSPVEWLTDNSHNAISHSAIPNPGMGID